MSGGFTREEVVKNIRKLPSEELKEYKSAYKKGQIHKYAMDEAERELRRRLQGKRVRKQKLKSKLYGYNLGNVDKEVKKLLGSF